MQTRGLISTITHAATNVNFAPGNRVIWRTGSRPAYDIRIDERGQLLDSSSTHRGTRGEVSEDIDMVRRRTFFEISTLVTKTSYTVNHRTKARASRG